MMKELFCTTNCFGTCIYMITILFHYKFIFLIIARDVSIQLQKSAPLNTTKGPNTWTVASLHLLSLSLFKKGLNCISEGAEQAGFALVKKSTSGFPDQFTDLF